MDPSRFVACLVALLFPFLVSTAPVVDDADRAFARILADARTIPDATDWTALRLAHAQTQAHDPDALDPPDATALESELANGERAAALVALDRWMIGRWTDARAHKRAASICERSDSFRRAAMHRVFAAGLTQSILDSGEGRAFDSAWVVVNRGEQEVALAAMGLGTGERRRVDRDGLTYDIVTIRDAALDREITAYFRVL